MELPDLKTHELEIKNLEKKLNDDYLRKEKVLSAIEQNTVLKDEIESKRMVIDYLDDAAMEIGKIFHSNSRSELSSFLVRGGQALLNDPLVVKRVAHLDFPSLWKHLQKELLDDVSFAREVAARGLDIPEISPNHSDPVITFLREWKSKRLYRNSRQHLLHKTIQENQSVLISAILLAPQIFYRASEEDRVTLLQTPSLAADSNFMTYAFSVNNEYLKFADAKLLEDADFLAEIYAAEGYLSQGKQDLIDKITIIRLISDMEHIPKDDFLAKHVQSVGISKIIERIYVKMRTGTFARRINLTVGGFDFYSNDGDS